MDTTIRNLDGQAYRQLKARAALENRSIGEVMSDAIRFYTQAQPAMPKTGSLGDLKPERFPKGNERLSEDVDKIVHGA